MAKWDAMAAGHCGVGLLATALLIGQDADAAVTYTYTGNALVTVEAGTPPPEVSQVRFSVTLADFLAADRALSPGFGASVLDWSITDGYQSLGPDAEHLFTNFYFATDSSKNIIEWYVTIDG